VGEEVRDQGLGPCGLPCQAVGPILQGPIVDLDYVLVCEVLEAQEGEADYYRHNLCGLLQGPAGQEAAYPADAYLTG